MSPKSLVQPAIRAIEEGCLLTVFTLPKPFRGHIGSIQQNAIKSWLRLQPACEVILFGDEPGTKEMAAQVGARYEPGIARSEHGTPLVNDLFLTAQRLASHEILCYVNADILLLHDLLPALEAVTRRFRRFLMVGQRWDLDVQESLGFEPAWEEELRERVARSGKLHPPTGIDYFAFPRGLWEEIPPFAIGRTVWDNWLLYAARKRGAAVVDATEVVMAVHQNHDYNHVAGGKEQVWNGLEARRNLKLATRYAKRFTIEHASWQLRPSGFVHSLRAKGWSRTLQGWLLLHPRLYDAQRAVRQRGAGSSGS